MDSLWPGPESKNPRQGTETKTTTKATITKKLSPESKNPRQGTETFYLLVQVYET